MAISKELLNTLVCVETHKPLIYLAKGDCDEKEWLFCHHSKLKYPIDNELPIMLIEEATRLDGEEADRLLELAKSLGRVAS